MGNSWLDTRDQPLLVFAGNLSTRLTSAPVSYGVVAGDATAVSNAYTGYEASLLAATTLATRAPVTIAAKDVSKATLVKELRKVYKKLRAANLAADKLQELALPIIDAEPTRRNPPESRPVIAVRGARSLAHDLRVKDELTLESKRKPAGADGYELMCVILPAGTTPPADPREWFSVGIGKRADYTVTYQPEDAGKVAHLRTVWFSPRGERGVLGEIVSAPIAA
jgi:hypothetical protein